LKLSLFIAKRYLFSKKSHNIINIISIISVIVISFVTMALIVLLSVFNGLEDLVISLYSSFDSDIKITAINNKYFNPNEDSFKKVRKLDNVYEVSSIVEENAMIKYKDKQMPITLKGVSNQFLKSKNIDKYLIQGLPILSANDTINYCLIGEGVAYVLDVYLQNNYYQPVIQVYSPKKGYKISLNAENVVNNKLINVGGIFAIQQEIDSKYIITDINFAHSLFETNNFITSFEINVKDETLLSKTKTDIKELLGNEYLVLDKYEQHETIYKILKSEKLAVFLILSFILIVAIFNVIGSLTMLIIEKSSNITTLRSLGATKNDIKNIFLYEGIMIISLGIIIGLFLGTIICLIQQYFGIIKIGDGENFIVDVYPVRLFYKDYINILLTVFSIGLIAIWIPVKQISKKYLI